MIAREVDTRGHIVVWMWCPGCDKLHSICIASNQPHANIWAWNSNILAPTFNPSLLATTGHYASGTLAKSCERCATDRGACFRCHSFIVDGQWQFLNDCSHHLAGKTVPIPELPAPWNGEPDPEEADYLGTLRNGN